jgi:hypothetical protein
MKKSIGICVGAAFLLVLASFSSVIGLSASDSSSNQNTVRSPLFAIRTARSTGTSPSQLVKPSYLGKGLMTHLFVSNKPSFQSLVDKALHLLQNQPVIIEKALQKALRDPQIQSLLKEKGITQQGIMAYFSQVKDQPEVLAAQFEDVADQIPLKSGYQPLGLNTTNPFACVITYIILLPVFLVIGLLIATITIVTCLNVNNCFDNIIEGLLQHLHSPDGTGFFD